jgi:hypothetical protein
MRNKKANATRSDAFRGFGLDQFVGKSAERSEADNPILVLNEMRREIGEVKQSRQSHTLLFNMIMLKINC